MKRMCMVAAVALVVAGFAAGKGGGTKGRVEWVDLGLPSGLLWADRNLGAEKPGDYGDYYAWGETAAKSDYSRGTYRHAKGDQDQLTKYCNDPDYGYNEFVDTRTILRSEDDAATQALGDGVRTPTKDEWEELLNHTTAKWVMCDDEEGLLLTSANGNSLFLPAAGYRDGSSLLGAGTGGVYCSSSLNTDGPDDACNFYFYSDYRHVGSYRRYYDFSVRPVRSAR